jgi:hypothetical protein
MLCKGRGQSLCQDGGLLRLAFQERIRHPIPPGCACHVLSPSRTFSAGRERCAGGAAFLVRLFSSGKATAAEGLRTTALSQRWGFFLYLSPTRPICEEPVRPMRGRKLTFWLDAGHRRSSPFPILS